MTFRGAYWVEWSAEEATLVPAGVLVASKTQLIFRAYSEFGSLAAEMKGQIDYAMSKGLPADELLDYYVDRTGGVTASVSRPQRVSARSIEDAAEKLLARSKHHV